MTLAALLLFLALPARADEPSWPQTESKEALLKLVATSDTYDKVRARDALWLRFPETHAELLKGALAEMQGSGPDLSRVDAAKFVFRVSPEDRPLVRRLSREDESAEFRSQLAVSLAMDYREKDTAALERSLKEEDIHTVAGARRFLNAAAALGMDGKLHGRERLLELLNAGPDFFADAAAQRFPYSERIEPRLMAAQHLLRFEKKAPTPELKKGLDALVEELSDAAAKSEGGEQRYYQGRLRIARELKAKVD